MLKFQRVKIVENSVFSQKSTLFLANTILIERRNGGNTVVISEKDWNAIQETLYLMRCPEDWKAITEKVNIEDCIEDCIDELPW
ncbi:hypothetical protein FACS189449_01590 [Alphaproteobacteria bacterium]|nr:hypothetical protein FACS189449_01590 [Alphaproteobacteria bacterium]